MPSSTGLVRFGGGGGGGRGGGEGGIGDRGECLIHLLRRLMHKTFTGKNSGYFNQSFFPCGKVNGKKIAYRSFQVLPEFCLR